jgi:Ca2+-binding EF-hand superfamily protein
VNVRKIEASLYAAAIVIFCSTCCFAQDAKIDVYPSLADVPAPLRNIASMGVQYPEQFVDRALSVIRQNGRDKTVLDKQDIETIKDRRENDERHRQVQQMLAYDRNLDGRVTRDEIIATLSERKFAQGNAEEINRQVDSVMAADANGDGVVTMQEMADYATKKINTERPRFGASDPEAFLALDPNGDGKLTTAELEALARKAFRTMDTDGDGILSREELDAVQRINVNEREIGQISSECTVPPAAPDETIVFIGVYEGKTIPTISVAGQTQRTDIIPLEIAKAPSKLYVVATSYRPMIWQIKGDSDRVSQLVLIGPSMPDSPANNMRAPLNYMAGVRGMEDGKINEGETGVPANKVTFRHSQSCGMASAFDQNPSRQELTRFALKKMLGRTPDLFASEYGPMGLHILDDRISNDIAADMESGQVQPPSGFDHDAWMNHIREMPGGLIDLKDEKVVSDAPAVAYEVLPQWAGMAKLVHDGALVPYTEQLQTLHFMEPGGNSTTINGVASVNLKGGTNIQILTSNTGYKIVRDISYYPSGLAGGFAPHFTIGKGVNPPKGSPGAARVVCEETGKPPIGGTCH